MKTQRMCAVCRGIRDKDLLLRVARKNDVIFIDSDGKSDGRGAYICKTGECMMRARKARALERSFSCKVEPSIYDALEVRETDE